MYKWGGRSKDRMQGVNPVLIEFANRLIKESKYDLTIPPHGGLRTSEEQKEIFNSGASKCDGYNKKSYHQTGNAIDIVIYSGSIKGMYNSKKLEYIGEIGKQIFFDMKQEGKLGDYVAEWGGNWKRFVDKPHWQLVKK